MSLKKVGIYDLEIHQGDTVCLDITISKMPFEINPKDKLVFSVARYMSAKNAVIVKEVYASDFNDLTATFFIDENDTARLEPGEYFYGVRYYQSSDDTYYKFTAVAECKFIIKRHTPDSLEVGENGL